jgi:putative ABC transport system permease protein
MQAIWSDFSFAFRNIARHRRRSVIAVAAVAFGSASLVLASGFIEWMLIEFRENTIRSQLGHMQIMRPGYHNAGKANPFAYLLPNVVPKLAANESQQIKIVAPRLSFGGLISHEESTLSFIGEGVGPTEEAAFGNALKISAGYNLSADDPKGIIVGEGLARNLGVDVGQKVTLLVNTASRGINAVEVTIRGLFSTVTKSYDDAALRMHIATARKLLRTDGSHVWVVLLNDTAQTDIVLGELRGKLQKKEFEIVPWYVLADFYNKTEVMFSTQIQGIRLIIALIILLGISNTMTTNVMLRIGEVGTSLALGVKRKGIISMFLSEGILLGFIGGLLGLIVGLLSAYLLSSIGIPMSPPPGMSRSFTGQILVTGNIMLESLGLAIGTTLLASIYPAWKASRMQIVDALRHNR